MRLYFMGVLLYMLFCTNTIAAPADSLKNVLATHKKDDTVKVNILLAICDKHFYDNPDTLEHYARKTIALAQQLDARHAEGKARGFLGEAFFLHGKADSALYYYNTGLSISRTIKSAELTAFLLNNIGSVYLRQSDYAKAVSYYDSVVSITTAIGKKNLLAAAYSNMANIFFTQGSYATALKQYLLGLKLYEEEKNNASIETATLNIANVYSRLDEYEKAKQYVNRARGLAKKSGSAWSVISCNTTLAIIHNKQQRYDSALILLNEALQLSRSLNNKFLTNLLTGNIAEAKMKLGQLDEAYKLYEQTLPVSQELEDAEGIAIAQAGIGEILAKQGKLAEGTALLREALASMQAANVKEQAINIASTLSTVYEKADNYRQALYYGRIKEALRDSLDKDDNRRLAMSAGYDYELGKKEAQITSLENDQAIQDKQITSNRIILGSALTVAVLAIIIAILLFRNMTVTKRRSAVITQQKMEIEQQAEKLERLNAFKDTTFSVLSHDLRSPINALTGTMAMLDEGIITPEEFALHKNELNNKLQSVTLMLDNLLQWAKSQMKGEHTLDIEKINVRRNILKTFAVLKDAAQQKDINLISDAPENLYINADRNQLEMVLRNLLSNAIKFTPNNGTISINAAPQDDKVAIMVTDSGVGMTPQQAKTLFDGSPNSSTHGTLGEKGTGIGLHLSHGFIINNSGSVAVQSSPGKGTTFTVLLPSA